MTAAWLISATVLILAVLLIRAVLGPKMGAGLRYGLWLLVLLRLLLPFTVGQSAVSPANLARRPAVQQPADWESAPAAPASSETPVVSGAPAASEPSAPASPSGVAGTAASPAVSAPAPAPEAAEPAAAAQSSLSTAQILRIVWLGGMGVTAAWFLLCNVLFWLRLRRNRQLLGSGGGIRLYVARVPSPCLFGLFRPAIYLTPEAREREDLRHHVLLHERTHLHHGDHIWALLRTVCLVIWWFHPLVWIAARLSRRDSELYCDEAVIRRLGEARRAEYGRTLLTMAAARGQAMAFCTASTLSRGGRQLKGRITAIARWSRPKKWAILLALALGVLAVGCAFTGAADPSDPEAPGADTAETADADGETPAEPAELAPSFQPLTDEELVFANGLRLAMTYEEVIAITGQPDALEDAAESSRSFVMDGIRYSFSASFSGEPFLLSWMSTAENRDLQVRGLGVGSTLEDIWTRLGLSVDDMQETDMVLYGAPTEPLSAVMQVTGTGETDRGYWLNVKTETAIVSFLMDGDGVVTDLTVDMDGNLTGCIRDLDLRTPAGVIGAGEEDAVRAADLTADPDNAVSDTTRRFHGDGWTYRFAMDPLEGGFWMDQWSVGADGGTLPLGLTPDTTLSEFLAAMNRTIPDWTTDPVVQLYGQEGQPLSAILNRRDDGSVLLAIWTETCQLSCNFGADGVFRTISCSGTPSMIRALPAVTDDQLVTGHGAALGMTYDQVLALLDGPEIQTEQEFRYLEQDGIQYVFAPDGDGVHRLTNYQGSAGTGGLLPLGLDPGDSVEQVVRALGSGSPTVPQGVVRGQRLQPDSISISAGAGGQVDIYTPSGNRLLIALDNSREVLYVDVSAASQYRGTFLEQSFLQTQWSQSADPLFTVVADDETLGTVGAILYRDPQRSLLYLACGTGNPTVTITDRAAVFQDDGTEGVSQLAYEGGGVFTFRDGRDRTWRAVYDPSAASGLRLQVTPPDGARTEAPDYGFGLVTAENADLMGGQIHIDGSQVEKVNSETLDDGTVIYTRSDGSTFTVFPDGTVEPEPAAQPVPENPYFQESLQLPPAGVAGLAYTGSTTPAFYLTNGEMVVLTSPDGGGWSCVRDGVVTLSWEIHPMADAGKSYFLIGYIRDGICYEGIECSGSGSVTLMTDDYGTCYFYILSASPDYLAFSSIDITGIAS